MAKKKNHHHFNDDAHSKTDAADTKPKPPPSTVVLKVDLHCDGCVSRITRFLNCFQGVDTVTVDNDSGKVTVTGNVDPTKLRDKLAGKTKKNVLLISPLPKKDNDNKNKSNHNNNNKKPPKEPQQCTAVLKVALHCQGCVERISKTVSKTRGVKEMSIDKDKETVTVKGSMNVKALVEKLKGRLKRNVEVVPPKKDKEKDKDGEGEKEGGGDGGKKKGGGGDNQKSMEEPFAVAGDYYGWKFDQNTMSFIPMVPPPPPPPYGYSYSYGPVYFLEPVHPPQMFSDENPNACSLM